MVLLVHLADNIWPFVWLPIAETFSDFGNIFYKVIRQTSRDSGYFRMENIKLFGSIGVLERKRC